MFKEKLVKENIKVLDSVSSWEEAVRESAGLLEQDGSVPPVYKEKIIEAVNELGPYIFIAPEIALPHVQYFEETKIGVSLLKLNEEISYEEGRSARLFFAFSAQDGESHITMIQELAIFLSEEENIHQLISMDNVDAIYDYIQTNG